MSETTEAHAADLQEASSIRYGVWVRLAYLTSGRWAVYHDTEAGGGKETGTIQIFETLDPEYLRTLSINEQAKLEEHRLATLDNLEARAFDKPLEQKSTINPGGYGIMITTKQLLQKTPKKLTALERQSIIEDLREQRAKIIYLESRKTSRRLKVPNHPARIEIVSNIPVPVEARGGVRKFDHYYPFEDMGPGDSFWVPSATQCTAGARNEVCKKDWVEICIPKSD